MTRTAILALAILAAAPASAQSYLQLDRENVERAFAEPKPVAPEPARPDPTMTPGAFDPSLTVDRLCHEPSKRRRHVSKATRLKVMRAYNMPPIVTFDMELDHVVPKCLGGTDAAENLWPQPGPEYDRKDRLETALCIAVCRGEVPLAEAQREIAADWVAAATRYLPGSSRP